MLEWLAQAHAHAFYALRSTCKAIMDDGWEDWKAVGILSVGMYSGLLGAVAIVSVAFRHRIFLPSSEGAFVALWGGIGLCFLVWNHRLLLRDRRWARFEQEFRGQSGGQQVAIAMATFACLVALVACTVWALRLAMQLPSE